MSSLRNAVKRITHKERSQPRARAHLGILEKHTDYKERAVDYHRKEDRIKLLREKAAQRNPDEFYFGMHKAQVKDGKHQATEKARQEKFDREIGAETIQLMKDQDLSYIRMQRQKDARKVDRLQASLHYLQKDPQRKHVVFVESPAEAQTFDAAKHFDTLPELVSRPFHRPRLQDLQKFAPESALDDDGDEEEKAGKAPTTTAQDLKQEERSSRKLAKKLAKARAGAYREMQERTTRANKLARAEAHLVTEKLVSSKGRKRKIAEAQNGQPAQYKWRRKRLR